MSLSGQFERRVPVEWRANHVPLPGKRVVERRQDIRGCVGPGGEIRGGEEDDAVTGFNGHEGDKAVLALRRTGSLLLFEFFEFGVDLGLGDFGLEVV